MTSTVYLVFKTHLDIGFTALAADVTRTYFNDYIPRALTTAEELRRAAGPERFVWTTGSWLIYEYLEQAGPEERRRLEAAVAAGEIAWHGLPFTTHSELMDPALFAYGLSFSQRLDERFGRRTIAAKMTDVPGHTLGIVPLLAAAGIRFLHIGVNDASSMPEVPPLFRWQAPGGETVIVMYEKGYGRAAAVPGLDAALAFGHTVDNVGPQTPDQVRQVYREVSERFPGAAVQAAALDDFARALLPVSADLPLLQEEIGDTWIHGAGSDPLKLASFRALQRLRGSWPADHPAVEAFSRKLILVPEHTWGLDEKTFLADHENYSAEKFRAARTQANYQLFEASWAEQRGYLQQAVDALDGTPFATEARQALDELRPTRPDLRGWQRLLSFDRLETEHFSLRFDEISGALTSLREKAAGREWAAAGRRLGYLRYQTFSAEDYQRFVKQYITFTPQSEAWALEDFSKPGMEHAVAERRWFLPAGVSLFRRASPQSSEYLLQIGFSSRASTAYGCPRKAYLHWTFPVERPEAQLELLWFDKPAARLPEALWLSFVPQVSSPQVRMDKLGLPVSPLEVVSKGARMLHAVGRGVSVIDGGRQIEIDSLDAPLLAPGEPALLNFNNLPPDLAKGLHFNLGNNVWGTNFPMWYEEDGLFRFVLRFRQSPITS